MTSSNGSGLFAGINAGLTSTYSILANAAGSSGVTLTSISTAQTNPSLAGYLNPSFASYIQTNFGSLDADHNGILSSAELSNLTNMINSTGMTAAQLSQLGAASGLSGAALSQVLEHFAQIDTNGDGKVTAAEIQGYKLTSAMEKKKTEFSNRAAANQSVFYADENASAAADASSLLAYKYMEDGSGGNTNNKS